MHAKNSLHPEENDNAITQNEGKSQFSKKLIAFLKKHIAATVLLIILAISIIWFTLQLRINENNFNNEKAQLTNNYELTIDSLEINHLKFATEVFSWSVRSELLRNNAENLNQLLKAFVVKSGADLVQIIDSKDMMVILSSDKKYEGVLYSGVIDSGLTDTVINEEDGVVKIITPVMGFNSMIGILVVTMNKN